MNIPATLRYRIEAHGHGHNGLAFYIYRNDEFGVQVDARRPKRGEQWVQTWTSDYLPDREFDSLTALREVIADIEPVRFKPEIVSVTPKHEHASGHCWVCRGDWVHTVRVKTGWRPGDVSLIPACDRDLERVKAEPLAAIEARRQQVRESQEKLRTVKT